MNHSKEEQKDDQAPPAKKQRKFTRTDVAGSDKHMAVTWMKDNPHKSARQIKVKFQQLEIFWIILTLLTIL